MKFAFSTLGCPTWAWGDILAVAKDLGYDGVEIRGVEKELYAPHIKQFLPENVAETKAKLEQIGLTIPCLTSSAFLFSEEDHDEQMQVGKDYIDLAASLGTPYVRVLGDEGPELQDEIDIGFVADNLNTLATYAQGKNVTVLLETNGIFADSSLAAEVLAHVNKPSAGILWDVHHPYRYCMEDPRTTYQNIKDYLHYVHMKDSLIENGKTVYKMMGEGDIPNKKVISLLKEVGFSGYVSLEWVKRWNQNLSEPGVVFPQFINYITS